MNAARGHTQEWSIESLRTHFDTSLLGLKASRAQDLASTDDRMNILRTRMDALFDARRRLADQRFAAQKEHTEKIGLASAEAVAIALEASKEAVATALRSAKEAVGKAEATTEKRFERVDEFRASLFDLSQLMMPRTEAEALHAVHAEKIDQALARLDRSEGQRRSSATNPMIAVAAILIAGVLGALSYTGRGPSRAAPDSASTKTIDEVVARMDLLSARMSGGKYP